MSKTQSQAKPISKPIPTPNSLFMSMGLDMSWRLAMAVLIPIIGGAEIDQHAHVAPFGLIIGLALATCGAVVTIRRTMRQANEHPVISGKKDSDA